MVPVRSILIVDQQEETRAVLRAALNRRGLKIFEAERVGDGLDLMKRHRPNLLVLDMEISPADDDPLSAGFAEISKEQDTPILLLGTARRPPSNHSAEEFVSKPYHYGPLIRKIESMLESSETNP